MWASVGLRPVVGTTIDFKVLPPILSEREKLLMLSCWQRWDPTSVPGSAMSQWLVGIEVEHGSDGLDSPTYGAGPTMRHIISLGKMTPKSGLPIHHTKNLSLGKSKVNERFTKNDH